MEETYGICDPATFFDEKNDELNVILQERKLKDGSKSQRLERVEKTWKASDVVPLIGMSKSWLIKNDPDVPKDANGHGMWNLERIETLREKAGTAYRRPAGSTAMKLAYVKLKGGVGNSTAVVHTAHRAAMEGLRVLVFDLDPQGTATNNLLGYNGDEELNEEDLPTYAMTTEPDLLRDSVRPTYFHNVDLIPANGALRSTELELTAQLINPEKFPMAEDEDGNPIPVQERVAYGLRKFENEYDLIIFDCPPHISLNTMNGLVAANGMINLMKPSGADVNSYAMLMKSLAHFFDSVEAPLRYFRIMISQFRNDSGSLKEENLLRSCFGDYVLKNRINYSAEIARATGVYNSIFSLLKPESSRDAYKAGLKTMEESLSELIEDMKVIWQEEAEGI
jgi:chromosome partitioning protein